tara:strand:+ start:1216 stop:1869 length:654 start_codon:yes stop_codon:yes gene_type:complete
MITKIFNLLLYILRYFSVIKTAYTINNKIDFGSKKSNLYFKKCLKSSKFYLEYGAGASTFFAKKNKKKFISLEADKSFYSFLKRNIKQIKYLDIGPTKYFSIPLLPICIIKKKINYYSNYMTNIYNSMGVIPDLILIDGRFRILTTLKIIRFLKKKKAKNITIIIDDYLVREYYKNIENIITVQLVGRFGIIKYNPRIIINNKKLNLLINKFLYDFR